MPRPRPSRARTSRSTRVRPSRRSTRTTAGRCLGRTRRSWCCATPDGTVSLGCNPAEYAGATGKIVVTVRGTCARVARAIYGQQAGAVAVVMINTATRSRRSRVRSRRTPTPACPTTSRSRSSGSRACSARPRRMTVTPSSRRPRRSPRPLRPSRTRRTSRSRRSPRAGPATWTATSSPTSLLPVRASSRPESERATVPRPSRAPRWQHR